MHQTQWASKDLLHTADQGGVAATIQRFEKMTAQFTTSYSPSDRSSTNSTAILESPRNDTGILSDQEDHDPMAPRRIGSVDSAISKGGSGKRMPPGPRQPIFSLAMPVQDLHLLEVAGRQSMNSRLRPSVSYERLRHPSKRSQGDEVPQAPSNPPQGPVYLDPNNASSHTSFRSSKSMPSSNSFQRFENESLPASGSRQSGIECLSVWLRQDQVEPLPTMSLALDSRQNSFSSVNMGLMTPPDPPEAPLLAYYEDNTNDLQESASTCQSTPLYEQDIPPVPPIPKTLSVSSIPEPTSLPSPPAEEDDQEGSDIYKSMVNALEANDRSFDDVVKTIERQVETTIFQAPNHQMIPNLYQELFSHRTPDKRRSTSRRSLQDGRRMSLSPSVYHRSSMGGDSSTYQSSIPSPSLSLRRWKGKSVVGAPSHGSSDPVAEGPPPYCHRNASHGSLPNTRWSHDMASSYSPGDSFQSSPLINDERSRRDKEVLDSSKPFPKVFGHLSASRVSYGSTNWSHSPESAMTRSLGAEGRDSLVHDLPDDLDRSDCSKVSVEELRREGVKSKDFGTLRRLSKDRPNPIPPIVGEAVSSADGTPDLIVTSADSVRVDAPVSKFGIQTKDEEIDQYCAHLPRVTIPFSQVDSMTTNMNLAGANEERENGNSSFANEDDEMNAHGDSGLGLVTEDLHRDSGIDESYQYLQEQVGSRGEELTAPLSPASAHMDHAMHLSVSSALTSPRTATRDRRPSAVTRAFSLTALSKAFSSKKNLLNRFNLNHVRSRFFVMSNWIDALRLVLSLMADSMGESQLPAMQFLVNCKATRFRRCCKSPFSKCRKAIRLQIPKISKIFSTTPSTCTIGTLRQSYSSSTASPSSASSTQINLPPYLDLISTLRRKLYRARWLYTSIFIFRERYHAKSSLAKLGKSLLSLERLISTLVPEILTFLRSSLDAYHISIRSSTSNNTVTTFSSSTSPPSPLSDQPLISNILSIPSVDIESNLPRPPSIGSDESFETEAASYLAGMRRRPSLRERKASLKDRKLRSKSPKNFKNNSAIIPPISQTVSAPAAAHSKTPGRTNHSTSNMARRFTRKGKKAKNGIAARSTHSHRPSPKGSPLRPKRSLIPVTPRVALGAISNEHPPTSEVVTSIHRDNGGGGGTPRSSLFLSLSRSRQTPSGPVFAPVNATNSARSEPLSLFAGPIGGEKPAADAAACMDSVKAVLHSLKQLSEEECRNTLRPVSPSASTDNLLRPQNDLRHYLETLQSACEGMYQNLERLADEHGVVHMRLQGRYEASEGRRRSTSKKSEIIDISPPMAVSNDFTVLQQESVAMVNAKQDILELIAVLKSGGLEIPEDIEKRYVPRLTGTFADAPMEMNDVQSVEIPAVKPVVESVGRSQTIVAPPRPPRPPVGPFEESRRRQPRTRSTSIRRNASHPALTGVASDNSMPPKRQSSMKDRRLKSMAPLPVSGLSQSRSMLPSSRQKQQVSPTESAVSQPVYNARSVTNTTSTQQRSTRRRASRSACTSRTSSESSISMTSSVAGLETKSAKERSPPKVEISKAAEPEEPLPTKHIENDRLRAEALSPQWNSLTRDLNTPPTATSELTWNGPRYDFPIPSKRLKNRPLAKGGSATGRFLGRLGLGRKSGKILDE